MKTKELGVIAVKITGIACLVVAAFKFHHVFSLLLHYFLRREEMAGAELMVIAPMVSFGLIILAGLGFLFAGDRIAPFITRDETEIPFPQDGNAILRIGVAIVGIWVMAIAIPKLFQMLIYVALHNYERMSAATTYQMRIRYLPELIAAFVQVIIGTWMFFGSRGVIGIRHLLRDAGHKRSEDQHMTK